MWIFSIVNTIVICSLQLFESTDPEPQIWRANCKLYVNFWLCEVSVPLTPVLFKGQPYIPTSILWGCHFLHILTNTSVFLIMSILVGMKYISLWFCICLLANDVEHLFFFIIYLFVYFWLCWVLVVVPGLSISVIQAQ